LKTREGVSKLRIGLLPIQKKILVEKTVFKMHTNLEMEGLTIGNKSWFTFIKKLVKKSLLLLLSM